MIPLIKSLIWVSNYPCQWRVKCIPERQGKTEWNIVNNEVKGAWVEIVLTLKFTAYYWQECPKIFSCVKRFNFNIRQSWDLAIQTKLYASLPFTTNAFSHSYLRMDHNEWGLTWKLLDWNVSYLPFQVSWVSPCSSNEFKVPSLMFISIAIKACMRFDRICVELKK